MNAATADVFLSYNNTDAPAVRQIQAYLKEAGLTTFLDCHALPAGQDWQPRIETALAGCRALVMLIGPSGFGYWQHREIQLGLDRQAMAEAKKAAPFPVIPVLLPGLQEGIMGRSTQSDWLGGRHRGWLRQTMT